MGEVNKNWDGKFENVTPVGIGEVVKSTSPLHP
jgi:hypothetical protein